MSSTTNALLFKFLMTLVFAGIALGFVGGNAFEWVLLVSILATIIDYLVGDLFIMPRVGGLAAAIINGILVALIAFVVAMVVPAFTVTAFSALIFAAHYGGRIFFPSVSAEIRRGRTLNRPCRLLGRFLAII